jgi:hypothetical protein
MLNRIIVDILLMRNFKIALRKHKIPSHRLNFIILLMAYDNNGVFKWKHYLTVNKYYNRNHIRNALVLLIRSGLMEKDKKFKTWTILTDKGYNVINDIQTEYKRILKIRLD